MVSHQDIANFLIKEFNIKPVERNDYYILPTICHNLNSEEASHKLYLYKNEESETPIFYCYTECGEAFNIYQLIQKYKALRGEEISFREAYKLFHGKDFVTKQKDNISEYKLKNVKFENPLEVRLPDYPIGVLDIFKVNSLHPWALEGIDENILRKFEIGYSASYEGVTIPHRDWRGNLVGLRLRTYNPDKVKQFKYMPMLINNMYYRHPVSLNFYGLFQNQKNIRKAKKVILVESEKAVLQAEGMLPDDNITLAVCGSSISQWQINMLIYYLGVEEVVIAFDKEYGNYTEAYNYVQKIESQVRSLNNFAAVSVLIDDDNNFNLKDSPFDRTLKEYSTLKMWKI